MPAKQPAVRLGPLRSAVPDAQLQRLGQGRAPVLAAQIPTSRTHLAVPSRVCRRRFPREVFPRFPTGARFLAKRPAVARRGAKSAAPADQSPRLGPIATALPRAPKSDFDAPFGSSGDRSRARFIFERYFRKFARVPDCLRGALPFRKGSGNRPYVSRNFNHGAPLGSPKSASPVAATPLDIASVSGFRQIPTSSGRFAVLLLVCGAVFFAGYFAFFSRNVRPPLRNSKLRLLPGSDSRAPPLVRAAAQIIGLGDAGLPGNLPVALPRKNKAYAGTIGTGDIFNKSSPPIFKYSLTPHMRATSPLYSCMLYGPVLLYNSCFSCFSILAHRDHLLVT